VEQNTLREPEAPEFMKTISISIWISLLLLFSWCIGAGAQDQTNKIIVDDFEKPGKRNSRGGDFGAFADDKSLGHCYLFFFQNKEDNALGGSKYSLYIEWDTTKEGAYGGYWTDLKHLNLEEFNYLTFFVKGMKGGEVFKVGLRGPLNSTYETKTLILQALNKGVEVKWQKVMIPLKWFGAVMNWSDVNILSINFENAFGSGKGAILIDEIAFEK
jgi:hypothetical protein